MKESTIAQRNLEDMLIADKCHTCCLCCDKYKTSKEQNAKKKLIKELKDDRHRLIFISYPTKAPLDEALKICRYWWNKGYIPLCPKVLFQYMSDDRDRPAIMLICKILICICDNFALYGNSAGCRDEYIFAKKREKQIYVLVDNDKVNYNKISRKPTILIAGMKAYQKNDGTQ